MLAPLALIVAFFALLCEAAAIYFLANIRQGTNEVLSFLGMHLIASFLFALVVRGVLPDKYREPIRAVLALLTSFAFFIPIFGLLALAAGVLTVLSAPRGNVVLPFNLVRHPEFTNPLRDPVARIRATGLRTVLLDATLAPELRLRSLMALQNIPIRRAGPLLKRLLGDPSDDMRLTAYGLLDRESRRIGDTTQRELDALPGITERGPRVNALRRIAEQYWELVYTGLAQSDLSEHALAEGLRHCDAALALAGGDPGLLLLKGRLLTAQGDTRAALESYRKSIEAGLPVGRAAPYIAQIAFEDGDYDTVRKYLRHVDQQTNPTVAPIAQFWSDRPDPPAHGTPAAVRGSPA